MFADQGYLFGLEYMSGQPHAQRGKGRFVSRQSVLTETEILRKDVNKQASRCPTQAPFVTDISHRPTYAVTSGFKLFKVSRPSQLGSGVYTSDGTVVLSPSMERECEYWL